MTEIITSFPKRPKWVNRQLIAASDLSAEQAWQDAQLSRLRRFAMGWGVVAGLEVEGLGDILSIAPGYGITAAGSEIYVPEEVILSDIFAQICEACGGDPHDCGNLDGGEGEEKAQTGWLMLKPVILESCPRATLPEGCEHPGSAFAYTRQGAGAIPAFECELPDPLQRQDPECDTVESYLGTEPVPLPKVEDDILPLAQITCLPGRIRQVDMSRRVKLLPMALMQVIVECCECHDEEVEPIEPGGGSEKPWDNPNDRDINDLIDSIVDAFPRGERDFGLQYGEIYTGEEVIGFTRARAPKKNLIIKSFAASLLVKDDDDLTALFKGQFDDIYADATGGGSTLGARRSGAVEARDLAKATVSDLWETGKTGYHAVQRKFGDLGMAEFSALRLTDLRRRLPDASAPELAAHYWMIQRAATIESDR